MAQLTLHKADTRGLADHGWLKSFQSFSFSGYYNKERMQFGALRVLNDDVVEGGKGFGIHPHDNMEIISILLEGSLEHKDNIGNSKVVKAGDIQVMSTGSGVFHSEYNAHATESATFLQIWLYPNQLNVTPRYEATTLPPDTRNALQVIISPEPRVAVSWIQQDAWFSIGTFDAQKEVQYTLHQKGHGVYAFVIDGEFAIEGQTLARRDGLGIEGADTLTITALSSDARLLLMEVPLNI